MRASSNLTPHDGMSLNTGAHIRTCRHQDGEGRTVSGEGGRYRPTESLDGGDNTIPDCVAAPVCV